MTLQKKRKEKKKKHNKNLCGQVRAVLKTKQCRQGFKREQPIKKLCGSKSKSHLLEEQNIAYENESVMHRQKPKNKMTYALYY